MTIFSENIALFTAPALKNSKKIFRKSWLYFFSDSEESGFKEEIYSQATHIWLGEKFIAEWDENNSGKYVKISSIGEIEEIWSFSVELLEWKITKITKLQGNFDKEILLERMKDFIEETYFTKDNRISNNLSKNWKFIFAKTENIISISENILYPSKSLVSFPLNILNIEKKKIYIPAIDIINTIKISENVYLDKKNQCLIVKNSSTQLKKWEILLANNMKQVPLWDDNKAIYSKILENLYKKPNWFKLDEDDLLKTIKQTEYSEKKKAFSRANFSDYLDFDISISVTWWITKTSKKEKK